VKSKIKYGEYVILGNLKKGDRFVCEGCIGVISAEQKDSQNNIYPYVTWESDEGGMLPIPTNTNIVRRVL